MLTSALHRTAGRGLVVALALALVLIGCGGDYRPEAVGPEGQITVVVDSTRWDGPLGDAIRANLGPYVETLPGPERYFELRPTDLTEQKYDQIKGRKNVVFVAPLSDSSNVATYLRDRLSEEARASIMSGNGSSAVVSRPNLWRRSQRVYYITAADVSTLIDALNQNSSEVRRTFYEVTLDRMEEEMFKRQRQVSIEDSIMKTHGFAVNVQHDYVLVDQNRTDSTGTVYLRRVLSDTWRNLMVHYVEDASPSQIRPDWIYRTRDSLAAIYQRGNVGGFTRIDYRRPLDAEETDFLGRYTYETRGLWHMVIHRDSLENDYGGGDGPYREMGGGGPFVNYTFYDQDSGRLYMIDGAVFAPGYDKLQFLRQMDVIAHTFRTRQEATAAPTDEAVAER